MQRLCRCILYPMVRRMWWVMSKVLLDFSISACLLAISWSVKNFTPFWFHFFTSLLWIQRLYRTWHHILWGYWESIWMLYEVSRKQQMYILVLDWNRSWSQTMLAKRIHHKQKWTWQPWTICNIWSKIMWYHSFQ